MKHGVGLLAGTAGVAALGIGALTLFALQPPALGLRAFPRAKWGPTYIHNAKDCDGRPVRLLRVGKSVQSATYLDEASYTEPVFDYIFAFDMVFDAGLPVKDILMVGGGGCAWPKHVIATRPDARIDVLEADPEVVRIARRYFFLDRLVADYDLTNSGRLNLICADGTAYLASLAKKLSAPNVAGHPASWLHGRSPRRYDAIVVDAFKAGEADAALAQPPTVCAVHDSLVENGILMANVVSTLTGPGSQHLHAYLGVLRRVFRHVYVAPVAGSCGEGADNVIVLASDGPWQFDAAQEWQA